MWRFRVRRTPDAPFVLDVPGHAHTYRELADASASLVGAMAEQGLRPGDRVGAYFSNEPAWVVASVAAWSFGCSIAACGRLLSRREAAALFERVGATLVVTTDPEHPRETTGPPVMLVDRSGALRDGDHSGAPHPRPGSLSADAEAVVVFSSGTTGAPKAVAHTHAHLHESVRQIDAAYGGRGFRASVAPAEVAPGAVFTPFGHLGCYFSVGFRLLIGRPVVLVPKFSVDDVETLVGRYRYDALQLAPAMIHMLAHAERDVPLGSMRYVTSGTAPLAASTRSLFEARYGVPVLQAYGLTEVGTVSQERYEDVMAGRRPPGSVGRLARGVAVRIVGRTGLDLEEGETGEILVRTPTMGRDALADEPLDASGWFRTGDEGMLADGLLHVTGRVKDLVIVGGLNVQPAEVEEQLRLSALVEDAVVVGVQDERLGEVPVAGIVWAAGRREHELWRELRETIAHYKVPRRLVPIDAVPLTARGKIDRVAARELVARIEAED